MPDVLRSSARLARATERSYRTLVHNFPNGAVVLFDHDLRYVMADGALVTDAGLARAGLEGHTLWESFPPETAAALEPAYRAALAGHATTLDLPYAGRIFEVRMLPVADDDGIAGGLVVTQDVSAMRQAVAAQQASEERFRLLFERSPDSIVLLDPHDPEVPWKIVDCNASACRLNGYPREELLGMSNRWLSGGGEHWLPDDDFLQRLREAGELHGLDKHRRKDGSIVAVEYSAALVTLGGSELVLGIDRDITERQEAEAEQRRREAYFRALTEHAADLVAVVNADGTVRYSSAAQKTMLGFRPDERMGSSIFAQIHPADLPHARILFDQLRQSPGVTVTAELRSRHRDGSWRILDSTATNLLDDPDIRGIVVNSRDVTERKRLEAQLAHDAVHDPLTGLPNRTLFFDRVGQAIERAARRNAPQFGLLFLDLDRFKTVNDSLGHLCGDRLLQEVSRRLEGCVRTGDSVARLGGDEFGILLENLQSIHEATAVAERVLAALAEPIMLDEHALVVAASIGITVGDATQTAEDLLRDADIAMYRAKRLGKARFEIFDAGMLDEALARLHVEAELRAALAYDELVLHYQPIMDNANGRLIGVEALVRWQHPQRGLLGPHAFISVAEETGLIVPLGAWVLREACRQAAAWQQAGLPPIYISVNVASEQLRQPGLPAQIAAVLRDTGLDPARLRLEVTETGAMADVVLTSRVLTEARALGLSGVAVDDFGTGYSSLSMLQQLPITHVKIDRSFVSDLDTNSNNVTLARTIIAMSHALGLKVVAEGVETTGQAAILRDLGCDMAQGYLFSRPVPADALATLLVVEAEAELVMA